MWRFPEIGVPLNHPLIRFSIKKQSSYWGTPILRNPHLIIFTISQTNIKPSK